jgi:YVTN family beta-propeller protein
MTTAKIYLTAQVLVTLLVLTKTTIAQEHTIIALSHSDHTVYEVDAASGKILNQFKAEHEPHEGVVSRDGKTVYVSLPEAGYVVVLDATRNLSLIKKIDSDYFRRAPRAQKGVEGAPAGGTNSLPHGVALNTDGSKLYITVQWAEVPGIVVYDTRSGKVLKKIDILLDGGRQLAVDSRTDKLYYPMYDDDRVVVIDTKTDKILKIIPVAAKPVSVDFIPGAEAWIQSDGDGSVSVIDTRTDEVIKRIPTGGNGTGRAAVSPDGHYVASTHSGSGDIAIIDARTKELLGTVPIGGLVYPVFSPDSSRVYVMSNKPEGGISVVDIKSLKVVARYKVGTMPFGGTIRYVKGK